MLSDFGFIVDNRVAGFLYMTNSNIAFIEWVVARPKTVPSLRRASLRKLIGVLVDTATMMGCDIIFGVSTHPSIGKEAKAFGFVGKEHMVWMYKADSNDNNMLQNTRDTSN